MTLQDKVGKAIVQLRKARGISQETFAFEAGNVAVKLLRDGIVDPSSSVTWHISTPFRIFSS